MRDTIVYLNGRMTERSRAEIPAMDYGFLYGYGLFETMRAYDGRVFRLDEHLARLESSAAVLGIPVDIKEVKPAVINTIVENRLEDARVRITLSAGAGAINADIKSCRKPTLLVVAEGYEPYREQVYRSGFRAVISSVRRDSSSLLAAMKTTNYLPNILARREAGAAGADEAICLNEKGLVAEASASNIFIVTDSILKTPGLQSGILPGITRKTVLELAGAIGLEGVEGDIKPQELYQAKEAFLTNSMIEIMPLTVIGEKRIGNNGIGAVTGRLMTAYREAVMRL